MSYCLVRSNLPSSGVSGIQGKKERERKWKIGTGTCKNSSYSSVSLPVKFTELYEPSHKYAIVVKFFLLHNMCQCKTPVY